MSSLNMTEGGDSFEGVTYRDKRIKPVNGIIQRVAAKKKVVMIAINPSSKIPCFRMTNQVPMKQMIVQVRME
jgi:hypothetical protein